MTGFMKGTHVTTMVVCSRKTAVIVASVMSIVGSGVSLYLNKKWMRNAIGTAILFGLSMEDGRESVEGAYRAREPKSRTRRYLSRAVCRAHTIVHNAPVMIRLMPALITSKLARKASWATVRLIQATWRRRLTRSMH
jgi:hypothetical protein